MLRAVLILGATVFAACDVGEVDIGGGGGMNDASVTNSAKATMFTSIIKPMAQGLGCLDQGCHSGIQNPVLNTYASLAPQYKTGPNGATNILVTKGGPTPPGDHNGPYFSATQRATIAAWINMTE